MPVLPSGDVTFLFTDIERSTRLWQHYPTRMPAVYQRHDAIVRQAVTDHHGVLYKTIGDAFQIAFASPEQALRAAIQAQQHLQAETWPIPEPFRVRMAIHRAEVKPTADGDYRSPALNLLGRLLGAAHGAQVVVTGSVSPTGLPPHESFTLVPLGAHQLRDVGNTPPLYQIDAEGLQQDFPPLLTVSTIPTNLVTLPPPFIGRAEELATIQRLLLDAQARLVTITGTGGVGKTRLALETATTLRPHYANGTFFVDLAAIRQGTLLPAACAMALGVEEDPRTPVIDALVAFLTGKQVLLVADNLEQMDDPVTPLAELLSRCQGLTIIATSRVRLNSRWEHVVHLNPLPVPGDAALPPAVLDTVASVRLFVARARALAPGFAVTLRNAQSIAEICIHLDGLPLALELAAARIERIPPQDIASRLATPLAILGTGPRDLPRRQQTLESTIAWSYDLLTEPQQLALCTLAFFAGGAAMPQLTDAYGELGGTGNLADHVAVLLTHGLIQERPGLDDRWLTMPVSVREFGRRITEDQADADSIRLAVGHALLDIAHQLIDRKCAGQSSSVQTFAQLDALRDTVRETLEWSLPKNPALAIDLAGGLWPWWYARGQLVEARTWVEGALDHRATANASNRQLAVALMAAGEIAYMQGEPDEASAWLREGLAIARANHDPAIHALLLNALGCQVASAGDLLDGRVLLSEMLETTQASNLPAMSAMALGNLGVIAARLGDLDEAISCFTSMLDTDLERRDPEMDVVALLNLAECHLATNAPQRSRETLVQVLEMLDETELSPLAVACACALLAQVLGGTEPDTVRVRHLLESAERLAGPTGATLDMMLILPERHESLRSAIGLPAGSPASETSILTVGEALALARLASTPAD